MFDGVINSLIKYGDNTISVIYLLAVLYLTYVYKKKQQILMLMIPYVFILSDIGMGLIRGFKNGSYYRFLWMLLIPLVIGIAIVKLIDSTSKNKMICVLIAFVGSSLIMGMGIPRYTICPTPPQLLSQDIVDISECIGDKGEEGTILCPSQVAIVIRQIDAKNILTLGELDYRRVAELREEEGYIETDNSYLAKLVQYGELVDIAYFCDLCEKYNVSYIVIDTSNKIGQEQIRQTYEFELYYINDTYLVYRRSGEMNV